MLIQSRLGGLGAQWRQLSKLGKVAFASVAIFFILAVLWGTGTVDVDYVRNQFTNTPDNLGNEPIPQETNDTPIIDGVPNDQNGRPIPDGVIEDEEDKHPSEKESGSKSKGTSVKQDAPLPIHTEPAKIDSEKSSAQDTPSPSVHSDSVKTESPKPHEPSAASTTGVTPMNTAPAKPESKAIGGGVPLRVMFIGASMTLGDPPQSAYRMQLRNWLVSLGNAVNCVGTVSLLSQLINQSSMVQHEPFLIPEMPLSTPLLQQPNNRN
ncbi:hypothetical protein ONZ43_g5514 [Nemania bipapillata]|uniref:Uncharacterized protein n=1 Tax=Nemania bipapillata TaxID=110536 RepID=A0ACC2I9N9_9PEZI|nr:hypothetical protein ONZ43_g5514 [Nemania bipapillata]